MRLLSFIVVVIFLASCHRNIAPQASVETTSSDSVLIEYYYHDTVIKITPAFATIHDTIPCPGLDYKRLTRTDGQQISVRVHGGILDVDCQADSLSEVIHILSKKISETRSKESDSTIVVTKIVNVPVTHYPKALWWSLGINILFLIFLYFKFSTGLASGVGLIFSLFRKIKL